MTLKVSVIIPTFRTGDKVRRVIDSLDLQTLPQDEFEAIFVDDGSPDDTHQRLIDFAAVRPNMHVLQIENSGWPSRPRNIGIEQARGEYVFFMDHDDSLYRNGLRRAYEYARENDSDIVGVPEFNTKRMWWSTCLDRNLPNIKMDGGIGRLMPFMPHNLYRTQFLRDHDIRFPEGARALWEGWYFNIAAYRHSIVASVLMDTPVYLRHIDGTNTSRTFNARRSEYWDHLESVLVDIDSTLDGTGFAFDHDVAIARNVRLRILATLLKLRRTTDAGSLDAPVERARDLLNRFASQGVMAQLPREDKIKALLLLESDYRNFRRFHETSRRQRARTRVTDLQWRAGALRAELQCVWAPTAGGGPLLRKKGDRVVRVVDSELEGRIPPEYLDVTDTVDELELDLLIHSLASYVNWHVPYTSHRARFECVGDDGIVLTNNATAVLDPAGGAVGAPVGNDLWDLKFKSGWMGMSSSGSVTYQGPPRPVLREGRGIVAYGNNSGGLSVDMMKRTRNLAVDVHPRSGPAGTVGSFAAPLENVAVFGAAAVEMNTLFAIPDAAVPARLDDSERAMLLEDLAVDGQLRVHMVADGRGAMLQGGASLEPGRHTIYARRDGELHKTSRSLTVARDGSLRFG